jgi:hypothetical protein
VFINGRLIHTTDWLKLATIDIIGTPGFYWLDANGYTGSQGNPLPTGILSL